MHNYNTKQTKKNIPFTLPTAASQVLNALALVVFAVHSVLSSHHLCSSSFLPNY